MNVKSFVKGPGIWIIVVIVLLLLAFGTLAPGGSTRVDTSVGLQLIKDGKVSQAKIFNGDERVDMVLKDDYVVDGQDKGKNVQFYYVTPRGNDVINAIDAANLPQGFSDQPVENNWFSSMLSLLIPVVLLGALSVVTWKNSRAATKEEER